MCQSFLKPQWIFQGFFRDFQNKTINKIDDLKDLKIIQKDDEDGKILVMSNTSFESSVDEQSEYPIKKFHENLNSIESIIFVNSVKNLTKF